MLKRTRTLSVLALAIAFILGSLVHPQLTNVLAQTQAVAPQLQHMSTPMASIPLDWGSLRGVSDRYLIFENSSGTIRMAFIDSGLHNFVEVQRR
jgi:hypothetical protein